MKKPTALEWFLGQLLFDKNLTKEKIIELADKAKIMEDLQIADAYIAGKDSVHTSKNSEELYKSK
jgi:hypothetical protein